MHSFLSKLLGNLLHVTKNYENEVKIYFSVTLNENTRFHHLFENFTPKGKLTEIKINQIKLKELAYDIDNFLKEKLPF